MRKKMLFACLAALVLATAACGPRRPVVYPDAKVQEVGEAQVRADVEDCLRQAREAGVGTSRAGEVAKTTAIGAGAGAAIGAAVGAFGRGAGSWCGPGGCRRWRCRSDRRSAASP